MAFNIPQTAYPVSYGALGFTQAQINENTLSQMSDIINSSATNWALREAACYMIGETAQKDEWAEAEAIYHWVQNHSRYVKDPQSIEMLQSPLVALDKWSKDITWQGDCDDFSILLGSLLKSIGYPYNLRIASYSQDLVPGHVYGLVGLYNEWYPIDGIQLGAQVGWENEAATMVRDWDVDEKRWIN
jgi:hypothetical protein